MADTPAPAAPAAGDQVDTDAADDFEAAFAEAAQQHDEGTPPPAAHAAEADGDGPPSPDAEPEGSAAPDPDKAAADKAATEPDIWANALPEQKAAYEAAEKARKDAEHRERSNAGRIAALQNQLAARTAAPAPTKGAAKVPDNGNRGSDADSDDEKILTEFEKDYPEVARPVMKVVERLKATASRVENIEKDLGVLKNRDQIATEQRIETEVSAAHPDWRDIAGSREFNDWVKSQPTMIQKVFDESTDPGEVNYVLDLYKRGRDANPSPTPTPNPGAAGADPKPKPDPMQSKRARQLSAAGTVPHKGTAPAAGVPDDFETAFQHRAAQLDKQRGAQT